MRLAIFATFVAASLANDEYLTKRLRNGPVWDVEMQSDQSRSERSTLRGPRLAERNVVHSESRNLMCSRDHILEAFLPLPHVDFECEGSFPKECHHCIAILIHLGCDIRDELGLIKDQLTKLIQTLGNKNLYPGEINLSFVYFGDTKNIQVPLTFRDPMNERFDIRSELEDHIIPDIDPRARSNITAALEVTFQLFDDYQDSAEGYCDTKTLYFITNGHVQCGECVCTDRLCPPCPAVERGEKCDNTREENDWKCWRNTNIDVIERIGEMKVKYSDINVIVATENDQTCRNVLEQKWLSDPRAKSVLESRIRDDGLGNPTPGCQGCKAEPNYGADPSCPAKCRPYLMRYETKFTEECFNDLHIDILSNWRYDQLKNDPVLIEACRNSGSVVPYGGDDEFRLIYAENDLKKLCEMMQGESNIKRPSAPMESSLKQYHHLSDRDLNIQVTQYIESLEDTCSSSFSPQDCVGHVPDPNPHAEPKYENGCDGPRGEVGRPGAPGPMGPGGSHGANGGEGPQGFCGAPGIQGEPGDSQVAYESVGKPGTQGQPGAIGAPGQPGQVGRPGFAGKPGERGILGVEGQQGESGCPGPTGPRGNRGQPGKPGPRGAQGQTGPAGPGIENVDYFNAYKRTLKKEIVTMIRSGEVDRNSEFVGTIVELFRERMGKVCSAGDCIRHQSSFAQERVSQPMCQAHQAVPFSSYKIDADRVQPQRRSIPAQQCPCRSEGDRFNEIVSPYNDRIIVRRPDPQVFLEQQKSEQPRKNYGTVSKVRRHRKYH